MSGAVDAAIRAVNKRKPKAIVLREQTIAVADQAIAVKKAGDLAFTTGKDADPLVARMLVFDPTIQAYRAVLTPPGSSWELVEKRQGPGIWLPGMERA